MDEKSDFPSPITMHAPTLTTTTLPATNTIATTPTTATTPTPITIPTTIITTTTTTTKITGKDGWEDFIAGSFAGMAQVTVGQPLDTIKVRLQLNSTKFKGPMDCLVQTIKNEGFFALYKGMASPLVGAGAVNALLFTIYSRLKELQMSTVDQQLSIHQIAIAGAGAGALNSVLASPVELLKIRMQAQYGNPLAKHSTAANNSVMYKGPIDCAKQLIREHGIRNGLFRGFWVTVAREIPAYGGFYAGFEFMKRRLTPAGTSPDDLSPGRLMLSGSTGGVCYWLSSYPLDVIKSKVQNQQAPPKGGIFYIFTTMKSIYRTEGLKAFTRGITPTLLRSLPSAASTFTVYELSMRLLTKIKQ